MGVTFKQTAKMRSPAFLDRQTHVSDIHTVLKIGLDVHHSPDSSKIEAINQSSSLLYILLKIEVKLIYLTCADLVTLVRRRHTLQTKINRSV